MDGKDYQKLLEELISRRSGTILILDALDECVGKDNKPAEDMDAVLSIFKWLLESTLRVKIIVSSRYHEKIDANWSDQEVIPISPEDNAGDIRMLIQTRIKEYKDTPVAKGEKYPLIPDELEEKIKTVFEQKSQGM
jgi:hypothetical protein